MTADEPDELETRLICWKCVGEAYLQRQIKKTGTRAICTYCGKQHRTVSISTMADYIETAFKSHYERTPTEPDAFESALLNDSDTSFFWERKGSAANYAIQEAAEIDEQPAEDVRQALEHRNSDFDSELMGEENPFESEAHYSFREEIEDYEYQFDWEHFEHALKTRTRFFNPSAKATLDNIFEGFTDHKTGEGRSLIVEAGPGTKFPALYRARVFPPSSESLKEALKRPDRELGSPPSIAALAGRMNPQGVSVFYGATEPDVAIGEVRPPVGSRVLVGRFRLLRRVRLLNLKSLEKIYVRGSVFDPEFLERRRRAKFLRNLGSRMTFPVMPGDEPIEYLVTQVIADYLAALPRQPLDGILYTSIQDRKNGMNVVLFHDSAMVAPLDVPKGTEIEVRDGLHSSDGWEESYSVHEEVPMQDASKGDHQKRTGLLLHLFPEDVRADHREPTLELEIDNVAVHAIQVVKFRTSRFSVDRRRTQLDKKRNSKEDFASLID